MNKCLAGSLLLVALVTMAGRPASASLYGLSAAGFGGFYPQATPFQALPYPTGAAPTFPFPFAFPPVGGPPAFLGPRALPTAAGGNLRAVASGTEVLERLAATDLPEDLRQRVDDLLAESENGFTGCEELLTNAAPYWQYKRCSALHFRNLLTAANAVDQEYNARLLAAAAAAATTTAAPQPEEVPAAATGDVDVDFSVNDTN